MTRRVLQSVAILVSFAAVLLAPGLILAMAEDPSPAAPDIATATYVAVMAVVTAFVPFLTYGFRTLIATLGPKMPRILVPFVALLFSGPILTEFTSWLGLLATSYPFWGGILAGAGGIVLRELWSTWGEHGWRS